MMCAFGRRRCRASAGPFRGSYSLAEGVRRRASGSGRPDRRRYGKWRLHCRFRLWGGPGNQLHVLFECLPLIVSVQIVGHEEASAEQIVTENLAVFRSDAPFAHLNGVEPGPVVNGALFQIDWLFDGTHMDAGETPQGREK